MRKLALIMAVALLTACTAKQGIVIDDYEDNPEESSYGEEDYEQALRTIKDIEGGTFEVDEDELDERYQTEAQEWISDKIDEIRQIELNV